MKRLALYFVIFSVTVSLGQITDRNKTKPAENAPWRAVPLNDKGTVNLSNAGLSEKELAEVKRIALSTADRTCHKTLDEIGDDGLNRKLLLRRVGGSNLVILEGGGDWEDSSDSCFLAHNTNVLVWVIELSHDRANLLLQTAASGYSVIDSPAYTHADIVTTTAVSSRRLELELTWWRFDGTRYIRHRCATERISKTAVDEGSQTMEELQKTAKIVEHVCR